MQKDKDRDSSYLLKVSGVSQAYAHRRVLKAISLLLYPAEIIAILGPNGSGKTTLLKVLAGFLKPLMGTISFGSAFGGVSLFLPEGFLYEDLSLRENLDIYARLCRTEKKRYDMLKDILSVDGFMDSQVKNLSRGQKMRGALCRAFLLDCSLYLLDEPLTGLDAESSSRLLSLFKIIKNQNKTIILSTHDTDCLKGTITGSLTLKNGAVFLGDPTVPSKNGGGL
ncbi:MAG: ABC transporter ATP-binding protein [Deltaproteobacteria bacterium]|nr:ABC transporter ATP-binding protein [Deltaproteobacteria bacterium]